MLVSIIIIKLIINLIYRDNYVFIKSRR